MMTKLWGLRQLVIASLLFIVYGAHCRSETTIGRETIKNLTICQPRRGQHQTDLTQKQHELNTANFEPGHLWNKYWPEDANQKVGGISAVAFDKANNVVVFHRGDRQWNIFSFDKNNTFLQTSLGPIMKNTVAAFHPDSGELVYEWGNNLFYLPHGLHIDMENNFWVTDVALHLVMKFNQSKSIREPELVLGDRFVPGNGKYQFCKPTSVAVLPNGDFFVADGYCNSRIVKFSATGERLLSWGVKVSHGKFNPTYPNYYFAVPHALTLLPEYGLLCVADRENSRIQCFHHSDGTFCSMYRSPFTSDRLYSVSYTPKNDGLLYVVNGPRIDRSNVKVFVIAVKTGEIINVFGPNNFTFGDPHDIAVTVDGSMTYVVQLNPSRIFQFKRIIP